MVENLVLVVEVEIHLMEDGQPFLVPLLQELRFLTFAVDLLVVSHSMMVDLVAPVLVVAVDAEVVDLQRFGLVVVILHQLLEIQIIF